MKNLLRQVADSPSDTIIEYGNEFEVVIVGGEVLGEIERFTQDDVEDHLAVKER